MYACTEDKLADTIGVKIKERDEFPFMPDF